MAFGMRPLPDAYRSPALAAAGPRQRRLGDRIGCPHGVRARLLEQQGVTKLVVVVAVLMRGLVHTIEYEFICECTEQLEVAFAGFVDPAENQIGCPQLGVGSDSTGRHPVARIDHNPWVTSNVEATASSLVLDILVLA